MAKGETLYQKYTITAREKKFCEYYVDNYDMADAYRKAYATIANPCEDQDYCIANGNMVFKKEKVQRLIKKLESENESRKLVRKDQIIKRLTDIINLDVTQVTELEFVKTKYGTAQQLILKKDLSEFPKEVRHCIKAAKQGKNGIEVSFYDKLEAAKQLSELLGWKSAPTDNITKVIMNINTGTENDD